MPQNVAGVAAVKFFGVHVGAGALAGALGFLILWPKTKREAFSRFAASIVASAVFGPVLVAFVHSRVPEMFESAQRLAPMMGIPQEFGFLYASAPLLVMAGLPAWWILGATMRWLDKRSGEDIAQMAEDARESIAKVVKP